MNYLVTARKWRPQNFEDVVGQEHITTTLKNAILSGRIAHAYIFAGPRGVGKTTTARILAKSLNCLNPKEGEPCNECDMCKAFANSQTMDVIEIDGASNRRIEEIRQLRESVKYAPTKGEYKIYIIDEVHMLTTESFNALLKTLEEPPEHTIFIFATTDIHKVPLTIISRCQRFDFRRIELATIKNVLKEIADAEGIEIDDTSLTLIAKKADGALRDAQSLFDQVISFSGKKVEAGILSSMLNLIDEEIYFKISDAILSKNFASAFEVSKQIYENGWNFIDFMNELLEHFRNIMTVVITKESSLIETAEIYRRKYTGYADKFSEGDILRILSYLSTVQNELKSAGNQKLKIEISLCHLIGLEKSSTISEILNKIGSGMPDNFSSGGGSSVVKEAAYTPKRETKPVSNVRPAVRDEVIIPEVTTFVSPVAGGVTDMDNIVAKWKNFVDQVKTEKLFFGSVLNNSSPVLLSDDQLQIEVEHPEDEEIITDNKTYLDKKTKEIFGKTLNVNVANGKKTPAKKSRGSNKGNTGAADASGEENSLARAIISELGGREIKPR